MTVYRSPRTHAHVECPSAATGIRLTQQVPQIYQPQRQWAVETHRVHTAEITVQTHRTETAEKTVETHGVDTDEKAVETPRVDTDEKGSRNPSGGH